MSHPRLPSRLFSVAARGAVIVCAAVVSVLAGDGVTIREVEGRLRVEVDGKLFTEYHYQNTSRPFLYPVLGPGGAPMSRNWPMKEVPGEERDHPHHRSLWWAHGAVNGVDFWSESDKAGRTVHEKFLERRSSPDQGLIKSLNRLVAKDGKVVGTVEFTITIQRHPDGPTLDWQTTVRASDGEIKFGDTKEGTMAIRLNESLRLKPNKENAGKPGGHIVNSNGVRDDATWGKQATWVDYYGPVEGRTVGVAIFDHPGNPRHPTWWHVRDYGLFAANPFGIHDFEKKPAGAGDLVVPAGQSVTFRYRFVFHTGDEREGRVAGRFQEYVTTAR
jgi:hypothetical protein